MRYPSDKALYTFIASAMGSIISLASREVYFFMALGLLSIVMGAVFIYKFNKSI
jgi:hypothetical protein